MKSHPLQQEIIAELHNRPFPRLNAPASISHMVVLGTAGAREEIAHINTLAERHSVTGASLDATCYYQSFEQFEFRWERHTEFSSYVVITNGIEKEPFGKSALECLPADWIAGISGEVISGDHIELREGLANCPDLHTLRPFFEGCRLMGSSVQNEGATLRTSLRNHSDGFGRILVFTNSADRCNCGRLARSLIELSAYRTLTLLALPMARNLIPIVSAMENRLAELTEKINGIQGFSDQKNLLAELSGFAADLEQRISDANFRFAATEAYYELVQDRLEELQESEIDNLMTLKQFHYRRFRPGFSTCQSVRQRMESLSDRIDRASSLLRTRVDLTLEAQNLDLLRSMDARAKMQLRMQQTVEGLSIVAISYYALNLLSHMLRGVPEEFLVLHHHTITALATPVVVFLTWMGVRKIRKQFSAME